MTTGRRSPVLPVLLFSALCIAATCGIFHFSGYAFHWPYAVVLAWFAIITLILLSWQDRTQGPNVQPFIRRFIAGMVIKLLLSLILLVVLVNQVPEEEVRRLASTFLLLYLAYLGFGTSWLVQRMRSVAVP